MRLLDGSGMSGDVHVPFCERLRVRSPRVTLLAKLPTQLRGEYLSLYVVMDLFSRYIVAWMLSRKENSALASQLIAEAQALQHCARSSDVASGSRCSDDGSLLP